MAIDLNLPFAQSLISEGKARGYNDLQISQILGSAMQENGLRTDGKPGDNGTAYGGFQWRLDREQALRQKADQAGVPWTDPSIQSKHWYDELDTGQEKAKGARLRAATTPEEAQAAIISALRPQGFTPQNPQGGHGWSNRLNNGNQIYSMLTGGQYTPPADAPAPGAVPAEGAQDSAMSRAFAGSQGAPAAQGGSAWDNLAKYLNGGKQWNLASALQGAGIAAMARDNPSGASAMASGMNAQTAANAKDQKNANDWQSLNFNAETGKGVFMNKHTGQIQERQIATPFKKLGDKELEAFNERQEKIGEMDMIIREGDKFRNMIADGKINLSLLGQGEAMFNNLTNQSTEQDRNAGEYFRYLERMRNAALRLNKGVQTEGDAQRAMNEYIGGSGKFDNAQTIKALDNIIKSGTRASNGLMSAQDIVFNTYGEQAPKGTYRDDYRRQKTEYEGFETNFAPRRQKFFEAQDAARGSGAGSAPRVQPGRTGSLATPEIGTIQKGYRFKGGNPADPNSWEKQ